ncbi:hypothetical protein OSTOST_17764 [Ostertagia ostertagi]
MATNGRIPPFYEVESQHTTCPSTRSRCLAKRSGCNNQGHPLSIQIPTLFVQLTFPCIHERKDCYPSTISTSILMMRKRTTWAISSYGGVRCSSPL